MEDLDHVLALFVELDKRYERRFVDAERIENLISASAKEANFKAEQAMSHRLDLMNEFREALKDQSSAFLARNEYLVQHAALQEQIAAIITRIDDRYAQTEASWDVRIKVLETWQIANSGKSQGLQMGWGYLVTIIAAAAALASIFEFLLNKM